MSEGLFEKGRDSRRAGGFKPGESGNPGGRSKGVERVARELADDLAGGEPFAGLKAVMRLAWERMHDASAEDRDRKGWAQLFIERAYGKPKESVEIEGSIDTGSLALIVAARMTPYERQQKLAELNATDGAEPDGAEPDVADER